MLEFRREGAPAGWNPTSTRTPHRQAFGRLGRRKFRPGNVRPCRPRPGYLGLSLIPLWHLNQYLPVGFQPPHFRRSFRLRCAAGHIVFTNKPWFFSRLFIFGRQHHLCFPENERGFHAARLYQRLQPSVQVVLSPGWRFIPNFRPCQCVHPGDREFEVQN